MNKILIQHDTKVLIIDDEEELMHIIKSIYFYAKELKLNIY